MWPLIASFGGLIPRIFGKTLSYKAARVAGVAMLAVILIVALIVGKSLYDRSVVRAHQAEVEAKASKAREDAAEQRAADTLNNQRQEKELLDAVQSAPGGSLSPAAHALACQRLRNIGRIPPACGRSGSAREKAAPD